MVRGLPVVVEICPCGPSKNKKDFIWIAYHTTAENLRVWKWHMTITFHLFCQYSHFMKFIILSPLLSATKEGFKALWTWCFSPSFPCTSGAAPVTQPGTTRYHNRGTKYQTSSCILTFSIVLRTPSQCIEMVTYCTSYTNNTKYQIAYKYTGIKICYKTDNRTHYTIANQQYDTIHSWPMTAWLHW